VPGVGFPPGSPGAEVGVDAGAAARRHARERADERDALLAPVAPRELGLAPLPVHGVDPARSAERLAGGQRDDASSRRAAEAGAGAERGLPAERRLAGEAVHGASPASIIWRSSQTISSYISSAWRGTMPNRPPPRETRNHSGRDARGDRKSTRLNSSHVKDSYA